MIADKLGVLQEVIADLEAGKIEPETDLIVYIVNQEAGAVSSASCGPSSRILCTLSTSRPSKMCGSASPMTARTNTGRRSWT